MIGVIEMFDDDTLKDTATAERRAMAINAMKQMQEISISLANDKLTSDEINAVINEAREKNKK